MRGVSFAMLRSVGYINRSLPTLRMATRHMFCRRNMLRSIITVLFAFFLTTEAIVPQVPLRDVAPTWEKESKSYIVPLHKKARTGLIDPALEEGLIAGRKLPVRGPHREA